MSTANNVMNLVEFLKYFFNWANRIKIFRPKSTLRTSSASPMVGLDDKLNEINGDLGHLCMYRLSLAGETLPSRRMMRSSRPGDLRPSTLPLGHGGSP